MLHVMSALAAARLPDATACQRHLDLANRAFRPPTGDDPGWLAFFTAAKLAGDTGTALFDLARTSGHWPEDTLARSLADAVATYPDSRARSKAVAAARLAAFCYRVDNLDEANQAARLGVRLARGVRSVQVAESIAILADTAARHQRDAEVQDIVTDAHRYSPDTPPSKPSEPNPRLPSRTLREQSEHRGGDRWCAEDVAPRVPSAGGQLCCCASMCVPRAGARSVYVDPQLVTYHHCGAHPTHLGLGHATAAPHLTWATPAMLTPPVVLRPRVPLPHVGRVSPRGWPEVGDGVFELLSVTAIVTAAVVATTPASTPVATAARAAVFAGIRSFTAITSLVITLCAGDRR